MHSSSAYTHLLRNKNMLKHTADFDVQKPTLQIHMSHVQRTIEITGHPLTVRKENQSISSCSILGKEEHHQSFSEGT